LFSEKRENRANYAKKIVLNIFVKFTALGDIGG
jgi:hypothetical protein